MYPVVLAVHNILRWVVLILGVLALARAYLGWFGKRDWTPGDRKVGVFFGVSLDLQLLIGLVLYFFLSPLTQAALRDFGAAMADLQLRFFALEHIFYMILAVVCAHVGSITARRAQEDIGKHRRSAIWFTIAMVIIVLAIPWWRPLLPGLG